MILRLNRLGFSHLHMSEASLAPLQAFRSHTTGNLHQVLESLRLESDFLSFNLIRRCFRLLPTFNNAFAKLMSEIDYPISSWEIGSIEEYLDYTINLLELLNAISSSLSHLNRARVSLSHALSLVERSPAVAAERLREITVREYSVKGLKVGGSGGEERNRNGKERVFHEAMVVLKSTGFWVCGVVLSGLSGGGGGDGRWPEVMEAMRSGVVVEELKITEERGLVKELEGVNESVRMIVLKGIGDSDGGMELKRRLEVVENGLKGLKEEEEGLFAEVMAARNEVIETLRRNNK